VLGFGAIVQVVLAERQALEDPAMLNLDAGTEAGEASAPSVSEAVLD
jgi:hypothetical protein